MLYFIEYEPTGRPEDRKTEHMLGRRLLEYGLKEEYGKVYDIGQMEGGKPYLPKAPHIYFNISHTKGIVVCVIGKKEIGIDVEYIRQAKDSLICRVCSSKEKKYIYEKPEEKNQRFTSIWTLKESYIKAIGKGLSFSLKEVEFFIQNTETEGNLITSNIAGWNYRQSVLKGKYILSICESK